MPWTGQVITLGDAREFAKVLLDETGNLFWTQAEQNALANEANRVVFRELVATNPEYFIETSTGPFTYTKDVQFVELDAAGILNGKLPYKIIGIEETEDDAVISRSNMPTKWKTMRFVDRGMIENTAGAIYGDLTRHYVLVGNRLYVSPMPDKNLNIHIYWINHLPDLSVDEQMLLSTTAVITMTNGAAQEFGDLVGVYLAKLMNSKQQGQNPTIDSLWGEGLARMNNNAQMRNVDEPMSVRVTRAPWE
jgi:hypothetical protein